MRLLEGHGLTNRGILQVGHGLRGGSTELTLNTNVLVFGMIGRQLTYMPFFGGEAPIVSSNTGGQPIGVTFANGVYSGTPTASGAFTAITGTARDQNGTGDTVNWSFDITVAAALTIVQSAPVSVVEGQAYDSGAITHTGGHGAVTLTHGPLPDGLNFSGNRITGAIDQVGNYVVTLIVTDDQDFVTTENINLAVTANQAPIANSFTISTPYQTQVTFDPTTNDTDPESEPLTITSTTTPTSGSITRTGNSITFTPATEFVGLVSFDYTIEDAHQNQATAVISVTVQDVTDTDPNVTAIQANGWKVTYTNPPTEFDPVADPEPVTVTRQGFDINGTAVTVNDGLIIMKRVREPFPNENTLTSNDASISEFIYANDVVTGVTNNSTRPYPKPIARWLTPIHGIADGVQTYSVQMAVAHAHARNGSPVASVRFTASDTSGNSVTQVISNLTAANHTKTGLTSNVYEWAVPLATLTSGDLITVDAEILPWVGTAYVASTDGEAWPSPNFTTLKFFNNKDSALTRYYAYVDGVGAGSPQISTDPVASRLNPYATINLATAAIRTANGDSYGGGIIRLEDGQHLTDGNNTARSEDALAPIILEPADGVSSQDLVIVTATVSNNRMPKRMIMRDLTFRKSSTNVIQLRTEGTLAAPAITTFSNVKFDLNGAAPYSAMLLKMGVQYFVDCEGPDCGQGDIFSSNNDMKILVGCDGGFVQTACYSAFGCKDLDASFNQPVSATNRPGVSGAFLGWNHLGKLSGTSNPVQFDDAIDDNGCAVVGNVLESYGSSSGATLFISGDSIETPAENVVIHGNTVVGERTNFLYNETGSVSLDKIASNKANIFYKWNSKSDVFPPANGNRIGNWPVRFNVGSHSNAVIAGSNNLDTYTPVSWLGEVPALNEISGSDEIPVAANFVDDRSNSGSSAGGGDYTPGTGNGLPVIPQNVSLYAFDIYGRAISNTGTALAGAVQPV